MSIQTEMDISTDRKRRTDSESRARMQKERWAQGLTGQMREQEQNQEKVARGEMRWHWAFSLRLSLPFSTTSSFFPVSLFFFPTYSDGLHVVGRQHALLAGALHAAVHPTLVDLLHIYDHISVHEGHLVLISCSVVIHCPVPLLWITRGSSVSPQKAATLTVC